MPKVVEKLQPRFVDTAKKDGVFSDGDGLHLRVRNGRRRWLFVYRWERKTYQIALGTPPAVGLAKAREKAQAIRELLADGKDPRVERKALAAVPTFGILADDWIETRTPSVKNSKSVDRWKRTLGETGYAKTLRPMRVDHITTEHVLKALRPIWRLGATAPLARGYIEGVLDLAAARGFRAGENPARWRGHMEIILGAPKKLQRGHHKALAYAEVPGFIANLREIHSTVARQLELTVLTATRVSEPRLATWGEFDLDAALWTIPAERTKISREHRVPLAGRAVEILRALRSDRHSRTALVFGGRKGAPLSQMASPMLLRRMGFDVTVHGMRSAFSDWAYDQTDYAEEAIEQSLGHVVGSEVRRAYRRGDGLEKRRGLMTEWAAFCSSAVEDAESPPFAANDDFPQEESDASGS